MTNNSEFQDNNREKVENILGNIEERAKFYQEALERQNNIMLLNSTLKVLKDLKEKIRQMSQQPIVGSPIILHPNVSGEGLAIYGLGQTLFEIIDETVRPSDEYQTIAGIEISEVGAIDFSQANVPYIIPRNFDKVGSSITVSLSDIDQYRLDEAGRLAQFVSNDKGAKELIKGAMGGYQTDYIFPPNTE